MDLDRTKLAWTEPTEGDALPTCYFGEVWVLAGKYEGQTVAGIQRKRVEKTADRPYAHEVWSAVLIYRAEKGQGSSSRRIFGGLGAAPIACELMTDFLFGALTRRIVCRECGRLEDVDNTGGALRLRAAECCFFCDFWLQRIQEDARGLSNAFVAGGIHYTIDPHENLSSNLKGCGGQRWRVTWPDGRVVETTNLWVQGPIPPHFRGRLPDTAKREAIADDGELINVLA